ncbi:MAG: hypothetical protein HOE90_07210 [Bacteriovoracaceae bacterium]|jgi:hypothetical protein|nr:hypothetical protein [Bacteriovoracaceae bacterium]
MCIMCMEILKGRMNIKEARHALKELVATTDKKEELEHYLELSKISDEDFIEEIEKLNSEE